MTMANGDYREFLARKMHYGGDDGFDPVWVPDFLFDFQRDLVEWATRGGRRAIFADCGLGKTPMQLTWAENVVRKTGKRVLILTPLAVSGQTIQEAEKFGIDAARSRDGKPAGPITVTNYEKLHHFDLTDYVGVVCDESSILKHFAGATQKAVTEFVRPMPYRLLCTATAAPNDYVELGTSSEALGNLGQVDMLSRFFKQDPRTYAVAQRDIMNGKNDSRTVVAGTGSSWRIKGHAVTPFWRWVASWARACRRPSDLGYDDAVFLLPDLEEHHHVITPRTPPDGMLFTVPAFGLQMERDERRRTMDERCELVADLVDHNRPAVVWCHLNKEGDTLAKLIPDSVQVAGSDSPEVKEDAYQRFASGDIRVLVTKPKIGAWGLNWQHCAHVVTFASHSYEQYYQSVRCCWRFGQTQPVRVDIVSTEGETHVRDSMIRKSKAADAMFDALVQHMNEATTLAPKDSGSNRMEVPGWV